MLKNVEKCQDNVLKCVVLSITTQRYSVYCQRGVKKPKNIHIWEPGICLICLKNRLKLIQIVKIVDDELNS